MSDGVELGLWLIGLGALLVCVQLLMTGPGRGLAGTHMKGVKPWDRTSYAAGLSGAGAVGVGSLIVAIASAPAGLVMLLAALALGVVFIAAFMAGPWLASRYSRARSTSAPKDTRAPAHVSSAHAGSRPEPTEAEVARHSQLAMAVLQASLVGAFAAFTVATAAGSSVGSYGAVFALSGAAAFAPALFSLLALLSGSRQIEQLTRWSLCMLFSIIWLAAAVGLAIYLVSDWPF